MVNIDRIGQDHVPNVCDVFKTERRNARHRDTSPAYYITKTGYKLNALSADIYLYSQDCQQKATPERGERIINYDLSTLVPQINSTGNIAISAADDQLTNLIGNFVLNELPATYIAGLDGDASSLSAEDITQLAGSDAILSADELTEAMAAYNTKYPTFQSLDTDTDGKLTYAEVNTAYPDIDASLWDVSGEGTITYGEYMQGVKALKAFDKQDINGDGSITEQEAKSLMHFGAGRAWNSLYAPADRDGDVALSKNEYIRSQIHRNIPDFKIIDPANTGSVTVDQLATALTPRFGSQNYAQWDSNEDNLVSKQEYYTAVTGLMLFEQLDHDLDGSLTGEELAKQKSPEFQTSIANKSAGEDWRVTTLDTNKDDKVNADEYLPRAYSYAADLKLNSDGGITEAANGNPNNSAWNGNTTSYDGNWGGVKLLDTNSDETVSLAEQQKIWSVGIDKFGENTAETEAFVGGASYYVRAMQYWNNADSSVTQYSK